MNIDDRGQLLVWIVQAEHWPRESPEISAHWHEPLATEAADQLAWSGRGVQSRQVLIQGDPYFEGEDDAQL